AEIVAENGEGEERAVRRCFPIGESGEGVEAVLRVIEDVAFGVPFRVLRGAAERGDFGEVLEPVGFLEDGEAARGADGFRGPFLPLAPNAFNGKFGERVRDGA